MVEARQDEGTFCCPICRLDKPHGHKNNGVGIIRWYEERHPHRFVNHMVERGVFPSYISFGSDPADSDGVIFRNPKIQKHWVTYQSAIRDERRTGEG